MAAGRNPLADAAICADAIDEFLENLAAAAAFSPRVRELRGRGALVVAESDTERRWTVHLTDEGFAISRSESDATARIEGSALDVLLVLYRRRPLEQSDVRVDGHDLATFFIDRSVLD